MSAFALVAEEKRILVRPAEADRKMSQEWEIRRNRDNTEVSCEPGKLIPALAYLLLKKDPARSERILREREWLVYPSPFRWRALPAKQEELKKLLLDPRRLWLDSLLRALTERARDKDDQTVMDDSSESVSGDLGSWIAMTLEGALEDIQEPPQGGMSKGFREAWLRKQHEIMTSREALLAALLKDLRRWRLGVPVNPEGQAHVVVLRAFRAGGTLAVHHASPFEPALNAEPQPNEARIVVVRPPAGGAGQAFWLAYHIAQIAIVTLPDKSLLGFHNAWAVPGGTFRETEEFESETEALRRALSAILGKEADDAAALS